MKKLIPMTDFVLKRSLKQNEKPQDNESFMTSFHKKIVAYANFLKQPLELGMFVPVDEAGNVLKFPSTDQYGYYDATHPAEQSGWMYEGGESKYYEALKQWEEAKEKVLFEDFEFFEIQEDEISGYVNNKKLDIVFSFPNNRGYTIEDLCQCNVELTPSAIKTIGL